MLCCVLCDLKTIHAVVHTCLILHMYNCNIPLYILMMNESYAPLGIRHPDHMIDMPPLDLMAIWPMAMQHGGHRQQLVSLL